MIRDTVRQNNRDNKCVALRVLTGRWRLVALKVKMMATFLRVMTILLAIRDLVPPGLEGCGRRLHLLPLLHGSLNGGKLCDLSIRVLASS